MVESREEQRTYVLERGESVENAFEDWSENGKSTVLYLPRKVNSRLRKKGSLFRKSRASKSLHTKELETQFNEEEERGEKGPLRSTREPSTDFLPSFLPITDHVERKTLNVHAPTHALTPLLVPYLFRLF